MYNNLLTDSQFYNFDIKGIIHIGAHYGEEYKHYKTLNKPIIFFEPLLENFSILYNSLSSEENVILYKYALGNENKKVKMNLSSNAKASSSILSPKKHLELHPNILFEGEEEVDMIKLNTLDITHHNLTMKDFNFMVLDTQGYEIEVLKGSSEVLDNIDYLVCEVSNDELYENNSTLEEIDDYLSSFGFIREDTVWCTEIWGNAFYKKYRK
jgi:FkbM family methyltransferase